MRFETVIACLLLPVFAFAAPLQSKDVFVLSKKLRTEALKEKSSEKRALKLKDLEKALAASEAEYRKHNPTQGDETEEKFLFFGATFQPVFAASSFNKSSCEKLKAQVDREDRMGKENKEPLTAEAQDALEWLKVLCK